MARGKGHVCQRSLYGGEIGAGVSNCMNCNKPVRMCDTMAFGGPGHRWGPWRVLHDGNYVKQRHHTRVLRQCQYCHIQDAMEASTGRLNLLNRAVHDHAPRGRLALMDARGNWYWCSCGKALVAIKPPEGGIPYVLHSYSYGTGYPEFEIKRHRSQKRLPQGEWMFDDGELFLRCPREKCGKIANISSHALDNGSRICVVCTHCDAHFFCDLLDLTDKDLNAINEDRVEQQSTR